MPYTQGFINRGALLTEGHGYIHVSCMSQCNKNKYVQHLEHKSSLTVVCGDLAGCVVFSKMNVNSELMCLNSLLGCAFYAQGV
jgi:hypothetical protein